MPSSLHGAPGATDPVLNADLRMVPPHMRLAFLTLPEFALGALGSAIEVLQVTNEVLGREAYAWQVVSDEGPPVRSSTGLWIDPATPLTGLDAPQALIVCGGHRAGQPLSPGAVAHLQRLADQGVALGGLCSGGEALARAGLLDGRTAVAQGLDPETAGDRFPQVRIGTGAFSIDRDRYTAAGGRAPMAMLLSLVAQRHGRETARAVDEQLNGPSSDEGRRARPSASVHDLHEHVLRAVQLMEAHITRPLSMDALAAEVGVSRRQVERLFKARLGMVPSQYYLGVRLRQARALLTTTTAPIMHIGAACGFETAAHFARCYRRHFGCTPSTDRLRLAMAAAQKEP